MLGTYIYLCCRPDVIASFSFEFLARLENGRCADALLNSHWYISRERKLGKKKKSLFFPFFFGMSLRWYNHTRNSETAQARKRVAGFVCCCCRRRKVSFTSKPHGAQLDIRWKKGSTDNTREKLLYKRRKQKKEISGREKQSNKKKKKTMGKR